MKAIMIQGNELFDMLTGLRKIDYRIWDPGDQLGKRERILLCSAAKKYKGYACGYALATASVGKVEYFPGEALDGGDLFGWELKRIRLIAPVQLKMRTREGFFEIDDIVGAQEMKGMKLQDWVEKFYDPIRSW